MSLWAKNVKPGALVLSSDGWMVETRHGLSRRRDNVDQLLLDLLDVFIAISLQIHIGKGTVLPYSLPSVGPGADPGVQARRRRFKSSPAVGCHYFLLGLWSPSHLKNVTVLRLVPSCTACWEAHRCEQLPQGCYAALSLWELNPRPIDRKSNALLLLHWDT